MKDLTKYIFCIFAVIIVISCEPEGLDHLDKEDDNSRIEAVPISDTGEEGEVVDDKKNSA